MKYLYFVSVIKNNNKPSRCSDQTLTKLDDRPTHRSSIQHSFNVTVK